MLSWVLGNDDPLSDPRGIAIVEVLNADDSDRCVWRRGFDPKLIVRSHVSFQWAPMDTVARISILLRNPDGTERTMATKTLQCKEKRKSPAEQLVMTHVSEFDIFEWPTTDEFTQNEGRIVTISAPSARSRKRRKKKLRADDDESRSKDDILCVAASAPPLPTSKDDPEDNFNDITAIPIAETISNMTAPDVGSRKRYAVTLELDFSDQRTGNRKSLILSDGTLVRDRKYFGIRDCTDNELEACQKSARRNARKYAKKIHSMKSELYAAEQTYGLMQERIRKMEEENKALRGTVAALKRENDILRRPQTVVTERARVSSSLHPATTTATTAKTTSKTSKSPSVISTLWAALPNILRQSETVRLPSSTFSSSQQLSCSATKTFEPKLRNEDVDEEDDDDSDDRSSTSPSEDEKGDRKDGWGIEIDDNSASGDDDEDTRGSIEILGAHKGRSKRKRGV